MCMQFRRAVRAAQQAEALSRTAEHTAPPAVSTSRSAHSISWRPVSRRKHMMPVSFANIGDKVKIRKIGGEDKVRQHLAELGFVVGGEVTVVARNGRSVILQVKDSRVALSENMANKIMI